MTDRDFAAMMGRLRSLDRKGIRSRLGDAWRALFGAEPKGPGVAPGFPEWMIGRPFMLDPIVMDHAKAVRVVATVRACVLQRATDMAIQPVVIERETKSGEWEPVERQPGNVVDVWHAANPTQTGLELLIDLHANRMTHGQGYLVADTFGFRAPRELWVMRSHLVEVVPGPRRAPAYYLYDRGGTRERIPAENVVAWHDYQPEESPIGASPLDAVQLQYETAYDLMRLFQKTVRAGGVTAGYFSVIQPTNGVPIALTEEQKNAIAKQLRRMRAQSDLPTILDQIKFEKMGLTPAELQTIENRALTDADICRVLGVPAWLIGIRESSGGTGDGSTTRGADEELRYWLNNKATLELRDAVMTERLVPMFGEKGVRFRTDLSGVAALNRPLLNNATNVTTLSGRPIATVNELRRPFGLPPIEDPEADELYIKPEPQPFGGGDGGLQGSNAPEKPAAKAKRLIDTPERAERWRGKDALMRKYEARFERAYVTMLRERKAEILRKLEAEGLRAKAAKRTIDLDALMSPDESDEAKIQRIYEQLIAERGAEAAREIALELEVNLQNREVQAFIESRKTVGLDGAIDTFLQELRLSIADGIGNGEGLSEIAGRIATKFEDYEQGRVLTIARTETVSAFNFASVEAWRQSGDVEQVEWLSARDSAVREAHADADGQVAGINAGFDVGGESLAFPGDPAGSPENVINCRCVALPVVNERARRRMWERYFPSKNGHANRLAGVIE